MKNLDSLGRQANEKAKALRDDVVRFLRDLIAIPSPSCEEGRVVERIEAEMEKVGFEEVRVDRMGSVMGRIGRGKTVLLYDSHVDTVGIGDPSAWPHDPFEGKEEDGIIYGRGASDNKGATAVQVYGAKLLQELELLDDFTLYVIGTVQEEDFDGLALQYAIEHSLPRRPDFVVLGECTDLDIYRGQRGRVELQVRTRGVACHASAPERGENAIYKMLPIVRGIERLNDGLKDDSFLGKGSIVVSKIECQTPSVNAVPDNCTIYVDRRLTAGEDLEAAIEEIRGLEGFGRAEVSVAEYERPSYKGLVLKHPIHCPTWVLEEEHPLVQAGVEAARAVRGEPPKISHWVFSTNGVASMGRLGIPTIGFGPSAERFSHSVEDQVPIEHLVRSTAFYALFPSFLMGRVQSSARARE